MYPYYLISRKPRSGNQLPCCPPPCQNRVPINRPPLSVSEMISTGTLHAINAVERGWKNASSIFRG